MLRCVALAKTDVSEERSASFIRVTRIGELETKLAVTSNRRTSAFFYLLPENFLSPFVEQMIQAVTVTLRLGAERQEDFVHLLKHKIK
jgi:hypothetical protein